MLLFNADNFINTSLEVGSFYFYVAFQSFHSGHMKNFVSKVLHNCFWWETLSL